jgi:hypothetical protein
MGYFHPQPRFQLHIVHVGRHTSNPTHMEVFRPTYDSSRRRWYKRICAATSIEEGEVGYRTKMETGAIERRKKTK